MLDRIREKSPERSPVAIVAMQPDDLDAPDHHNHDHSHSHSEDSDDAIHPKIMQCRVSTEWNGRGEHKTFADRAMRDWRRAWFGGTGSSGGVGMSGDDTGNNANGNIIAPRGGGGRNLINIRPKVPRISRGGSRDEMEEDDEIEYVDEPISTAMVVVFLAIMAAYVWRSYGDVILSISFRDFKQRD